MNYKKIVVAGGGILGSQIAFQSAYCGFDVVILVRPEDNQEEINNKLNTRWNIKISSVFYGNEKIISEEGSAEFTTTFGFILAPIDFIKIINFTV